MKIAIVSDIHANQVALEAVLIDAYALGANDGLWVAGDTIGYGPNPNQCLEIIRQRATAVVAGNHELAAIGEISVDEFNPYAAAAARWTASELTGENVDYVSGLPKRAVTSGFTIVHGSPRDPVWEYTITEDAILGNLDHFATPGCVIGHSHMQFFATVVQNEVVAVPGGHGMRIDLTTERYYVNPGSVGQPRDGDPAAAYCVLDTEAFSIAFRRIEYDIAETQKRMEAADLPEPLIQRLALGR